METTPATRTAQAVAAKYETGAALWAVLFPATPAAPARLIGPRRPRPSAARERLHEFHQSCIRREQRPGFYGPVVQVPFGMTYETQRAALAQMSR